MNNNKLKNFSISFFAMLLGMMGFTVAFQKGEQFLHFPFVISNYLLWFVLTVTAIVVITYLLKIVKYPNEIKKEFNHKIKMNFFPTTAIIFLLVSILFLDINHSVSKVFWFIGTIGQSFFLFRIITKWMNHKGTEIHHFNPAWFIPAVGNILVPVAGVKMLHTEVSWFFFAVGIVFWIVLLVILFNRIFFHHPLPEKLFPMLFLIIAPPAVGFISYVKLTHHIDPFAKILYYFALFATILLLSQFRYFKQIKFYFSWWAYSFPMAAFTTASILFYHKTNMVFLKYIAITGLSITSLLVGYLLIKTLISIIKGEICVEED
ncbi:MAG: SLAC1 anion channel family protein [Candidatus Cloacimonadota bacterium]|nr:SLAC1 anion channel family protein [Candidatus Cloacimonadota bacterium]